MYHPQRTVFVDATGNYTMLALIVCLFSGLGSTLHGKLQLSAGKGIGIVHIIGFHP